MAKVDEWSDEIGTLSKMANVHPHAAYAAMTHGLIHRWTYICRTVPNIQSFLKSLDEKVATTLIPFLTGRPPPGPSERKILALPPRQGGLGIYELAKRSVLDHEASVKICEPIVNQILSGTYLYDYQCTFDQVKVKREIRDLRKEQEQAVQSTLIDSLGKEDQRKLLLAGERGANGLAN